MKKVMLYNSNQKKSSLTRFDKIERVPEMLGEHNYEKFITRTKEKGLRKLEKRNKWDSEAVYVELN